MDPVKLVEDLLGHVLSRIMFFKPGFAEFFPDRKHICLFAENFSFFRSWIIDMEVLLVSKLFLHLPNSATGKFVLVYLRLLGSSGNRIFNVFWKGIPFFLVNSDLVGIPHPVQGGIVVENFIVSFLYKRRPHAPASVNDTPSESVVKLAPCDSLDGHSGTLTHVYQSHYTSE